jgi:hypothetical protein
MSATVTAMGAASAVHPWLGHPGKEAGRLQVRFTEKTWCTCWIGLRPSRTQTQP